MVFEYTKGRIDRPAPFEAIEIPYSLKLRNVKYGDRLQVEDVVWVVNSLGYSNRPPERIYCLGLCTEVAWTHVLEHQRERQAGQYLNNFLRKMGGKEEKVISKSSSPLGLVFTVDDLIGFADGT